MAVTDTTFKKFFADTRKALTELTATMKTILVLVDSGSPKIPKMLRDWRGQPVIIDPAMITGMSQEKLYDRQDPTRKKFWDCTHVFCAAAKGHGAIVYVIPGEAAVIAKLLNYAYADEVMPDIRQKIIVTSAAEASAAIADLAGVAQPDAPDAHPGAQP